MKFRNINTFPEIFCLRVLTNETKSDEINAGFLFPYIVQKSFENECKKGTISLALFSIKIVQCANANVKRESKRATIEFEIRSEPTAYYTFTVA